MYPCHGYTRLVIRRVVLSGRALKDLRRLPRYIADKLQLWVLAVREQGLETVRKIPGFHDEPLRGDRRGQRSIRLSRAYRAIYVIRDDGTAEFVSIEEVSKHDY